MFLATNSIFYFTLFNTLVQIQSLVEKPATEDNYIVSTETAIRNTINNLFSSLNFNLDLRKPRVKQHSIVHNFFVSITLQDHDNLKEIARLTKLAKTDNSIDIFITQLNEVLNEDNKSDEATDAVYVTTLIGTFLEGIEYLKEQYGLNNNVSIFDVNKDVLKHLRAGEHFYENNTDSNENNGTLIEPLSLHNATERRTGNETEGDLLGQGEFWEPEVSGRRIYQGKRIKIRQFPFMASVQFFKKFQCGGSIIKSDLVITSASCLQLAWNNRFFRENPSFLSVQVGSDYYETGDENIPIQEIYFHPSYNPKNLRHNLAIMRLQRMLLFSRHTNKIKKIDIDRAPLPLAANTEKIIIIGWGARGTSNILKNPWINRLSYAELDFYPLRECQDIYSKEFVTDRHFCAGFFSKGGGACNRDAGGPGVVDGLLYGVVSFGSPVCGAPDAPTVFTKLGYYTDWVEQILEQNVPAVKQRTTTKSVHLPRTFVIPFKNVLMNEHELTTKGIRPVNENEELEAEEPHVEHMKEYDSDNDHLRTDDKLFKEFMSTMFESKQLEEYLDHATNNKDKEKNNEDDDSDKVKDATRTRHKPKRKPMGGKKRLRHKSTTVADNQEETKQVTMLDLESFKLENLDHMHDMFLKSHKQTKPPKRSSKKHPTSNEDKKLEDVIVSLIDNLDIQNILESKSIEKMLSTSQEDSKETILKKIGKQKVLKIKEEKKKPTRSSKTKSTKSQQETSVAPPAPQLDQATIKQIAKVMNMDESVLTFLYLNNMKSKQNQTLKNKKAIPNILKHKDVLNIRNRHDDDILDDEGKNVESDDAQEDDDDDDDDDIDSEGDDDDEDYSDDDYEALSIQQTAVKTTVKPQNSKNELDIDINNGDDIFQKLLQVVEKETT